MPRYRKPFKNFRTDNKHPTRTCPEVNVEGTFAISLFKNLSRVIYMRQENLTMEQSVEKTLKIMPWFREHCLKLRPHWVSNAKYQKGLLDLLATVQRTLVKYLPGANVSKISLERRAGISLSCRLLRTGRTLASAEEAATLVQREMRRLASGGRMHQ